MSVLHEDFETRSPVDLKKTGVHVYAEHPDTDVWCMAYAFDDEPPEIWLKGQPIPPRVKAHYEAGGQVTCHNAAFELAIHQRIMTPRYGWPEIKIEQLRCTMATAYSMSLPGSLENMSAALGSQHRKDMVGHRTMMVLARPRKPKKGEAPGLYWNEDESKKAVLYDYAKKDVVAERDGDKRLVRMRPSETALWHLDQRINNRGIFIDVDLCRRAMAIAEIITKRLDREMAVVTDWEVTACSQVQMLKTWVTGQGIETTKLNKEAIGELLIQQDLPAKVRRAIELRQEASKASVSKIETLMNGRNADGRARGLLQFHAAHTGRWGGRRFQPQNLPSRDLIDNVDLAIEIILKYPAARAVTLLEMTFEEPVLTVLSHCIRGMVKAPPGRKLVVADFSSIEGVVLAWLAGETWVLDAFREYVAGRAPDLYIQTYCRAFQVPFFDKNDKRRKVGKVMDLASGFQGGHGAYIRMGATGSTLRALVEATRQAVHPAEWDVAALKFDSGRCFGLAEDEWTALRLVIDRWRSSHENTQQLWYDVEAAAIEAVQSKGETIRCGPVAFKVVGSFLWCRLPSGRTLSYPYPQIRNIPTPWGEPKPSLTFKTEPNVSNFGRIVDDPSNTSRWARISTYGGSLTENITQAVARDLLAAAMPRVENAGYEVILHVHDEIVCEVDLGFGSADEFEGLMTQIPDWAAGLPVAAEAYQSDRYRK